MKYALVTAASRGIGWACVESLLNEGVTVYMATLQSEIESEKAKFEPWLEKGLHPIAYDAFDLESYDKMFAQIGEETGGQLDVLVNNFGWTNPTIDLDVARINLDDFMKIVTVNLKSVVACIQRAIPLMMKGGAIVNIASIAGHVPDMTELGYGTAKAAICHITKQCAGQLSPMGIRVNAVLPGITATDAVKQALTADYAEFFLRHVPLHRMAEPAEIAAGVMSMVNNNYITGQCLEVTGGFGATTPLYADMLAMAMQMSKN